MMDGRRNTVLLESAVSRNILEKMDDLRRYKEVL